MRRVVHSKSPNPTPDQHGCLLLWAREWLPAFEHTSAARACISQPIAVNGLPIGELVTFYVTAVNDHGESIPTEAPEPYKVPVAVPGCACTRMGPQLEGCFGLAGCDKPTKILQGEN